ncbi:MAG: hypothetical protein OXI80_15470 [Caldilineaceae bacterium]|nr:hypothetical protein [Caldilineaceae bacterium]MDE0339070.1 hypothetical protein [Caldilineaceae bacterium]
MEMKRGLSVRGLSATVFVLILAIGLALLYAASAEARPALHPCPGNEGQIVESGFLHDLNCGTHTPTSTPTNTPTSTDTPTNTSTPTNTPTSTDTPTSTSTPTSTATPTPTSTSTPTPTGEPLPTNTPTSTPAGGPLPTNTPTSTPAGEDLPANAPTSTPTPTPAGGLQPANAPTSTPTPLGGHLSADAPTSTPTPTPAGGLQPANAPTSTPTPAGEDLPADALTETQGESFHLQTPCIVAHAATPAQLCLTTAGIEYYFIGPDGVATGPLLPTMSELANTHTTVSLVVGLYSGANPLTGKSVQIDYLPNEKVIRVSTYYADTPYSIDKPYIFTLNESYQVTHLAW